MSNKLNTKDIKTGAGPVKLLQPGNAVCTLHGVKLQPFQFKPGGLELVLSLEGPDLGPTFEGFFINKDDESKGRHKGQVGQVKAGEWAFADGETKTGIPVRRDDDILKFMKNLCTALGINKWLDDQNDKHDTIESLVMAFNNEKPFAGKAIEYCIGGKEYLNKTGFMNYDLFLPKFSKTGAPFGTTRVITFNPDEHIRKKKVETVTAFGDDPGTSIGGPAAADFKLDDEPDLN
jgi:hypothetical protein